MPAPCAQVALLRAAGIPAGYVMAHITKEAFLGPHLLEEVYELIQPITVHVFCAAYIPYASATRLPPSPSLPTLTHAHPLSARVAATSRRQRMRRTISPAKRRADAAARATRAAFATTNAQRDRNASDDCDCDYGAVAWSFVRRGYYDGGAVAAAVRFTFAVAGFAM